MDEENKGKQSGPAPNPFIDGVKKFIGREVVVQCFTATGLVEFKGVCEAIEFQHKTVIVRDDKFTHMIPHYMNISRPRAHPAASQEPEANGKKKK